MADASWLGLGGKLAPVTGANGGIGRATVRRFLNVVRASLRPEVMSATSAPEELAV